MSYILSFLAIIISIIGTFGASRLPINRDLGNATIVPVQQGGIGTTTLSRNAVVLGNGTGSLFASSSPSLGAIYATSTATSTLYNGLNIETGCLSVNGSCIVSGISAAITSLNGLIGAIQTFSTQGPLIITSSGTNHQFLASSSPTLGDVVATSSVISNTFKAIDSSGWRGKSSGGATAIDVGVGPSSDVSVYGDFTVGLNGIVNNNMVAGTLAIPTFTNILASSQANASFNFIPKGNGAFGIGTSTASTTLAVQGDALIAGTTTVKGLLATSTVETLKLRVSGSATTTFVGGIISPSAIFSGGLTVTGGSILNTSTATSTWSGGHSLTSIVATGQGSFLGWLSSGTSTSVANFAVDGTGTNSLLLIASSTRTAFSINGQGLVGIGGTTTPGAALAIVGSAFVQEKKLTAASTVDIDWSKGNQQLVTLTGATTISFANGRDGGAYRLVSCQDSTGSRIITWPATTTLHWQGIFTAPIASTIPGRCDVYSFIMTSGTSSTIYLGVGALAF